MSMKVVLAGGGTAGHVNPLLATAKALTERGIDVCAIGTEEGLEAELVPAAGIEFFEIPRVPLPRRIGKGLFEFPGKYKGAVARAGQVLDGTGAAVAVGFGGFASTPLYAAARKRSLPFVVHEQNVKPGLANRYGARKAAVVALTFRSTRLLASSGATRVVGLPLRQKIADLAALRDDADARGSAHVAAAEELGVDPALPTLLVTGGSLGAKHLNDVLVQASPAFDEAGIQVVHLTGRGKDGPVRKASAKAANYRVIDYLTDMELAYAVADLVLCRSGAGTVAELAALGIPGYFVPLPIGNGEQEKNAAEAVRAGGARLVRDRDFSLKNVTDEIIPLVLDGDRLAAMSTALSELMPVDADRRLAQLIEETGERR